MNITINSSSITIANTTYSSDSVAYSINGNEIAFIHNPTLISLTAGFVLFSEVINEATGNPFATVDDLKTFLQVNFMSSDNNFGTISADNVTETTSRVWISPALKASIPGKENAGVAQGLIDNLLNGVPIEGNSLLKLYNAITSLNAIVTGNTPDGDNLINTIQELLTLFSTYPEGVDIAMALAGKEASGTAQNLIDGLKAGSAETIASLKLLIDNIETGTGSGIESFPALPVTNDLLANAFYAIKAPADNFFRFYKTDAQKNVIPLIEGVNFFYDEDQFEGDGSAENPFKMKGGGLNGGMSDADIGFSDDNIGITFLTPDWKRWRQTFANGNPPTPVYTDITITPAAPTVMTINDITDKMNWTNNPDFLLVSDYEWRAVGLTDFATCTAKPQTIPNANIAVGDLELRVKARPGYYASPVLENTGVATLTPSLNLIRKSEDFTHADWTLEAPALLVDLPILAPFKDADGNDVIVQKALVTDNDTNTKGFGLLYEMDNLVEGEDYVLSFFARPIDYGHPTLIPEFYVHVIGNLAGQGVANMTSATGNFETVGGWTNANPRVLVPRNDPNSGGWTRFAMNFVAESPANRNLYLRHWEPAFDNAVYITGVMINHGTVALDYIRTL